ncbi:MAG: hypothetical protein CVV03_11790 [Firmicutes bacterium HGW-Firmicutes-8]|nr:MAG: hypothetical protein CVV03_11790 [Firmicutes bacterium HGW-Firmicutes-8]
MRFSRIKVHLMIAAIFAVAVTFVFAGCSQVKVSSTSANPAESAGKHEQSNTKPVENPEEIRIAAKKAGVNELGLVPILVYHLIGDKEGRWIRTPENFRRDLQELYERNYVLVPLNDYLSGNMNLPLGKSPAIITFDDSTAGQFRLLEKDGQTTVDPNCAVGILRDFSAKHPGFGHAATFFINAQPFAQSQFWQKKLQMLNEWGFEIGNHTYNHKNLKGMTPVQVADEIIKLQEHIQLAVPGYQPRSFAIVQDGLPVSYDAMMKGNIREKEYKHDGVLRWAWSAALSPFDKGYDPGRIQRIQVFQDNGRSSLVNWLDRITAKRYVSDGRTATLTIPDSSQDKLKENTGKELMIYKKDETKLNPDKEQQASEAKGVHVTFCYASSKARMDTIFALADKKKLNTVQLDVKDESGRIGYLSQVKMAREIGSGRKMMPIRELLADFKKRGIYSIARIVIFRDPFLTQKKPYLKVRNQDGSSVLKGEWVSPYSREVWDYNVDLAIEAYELGFDEVQFDYIRFPEGARTAVYSGKDGKQRVDVIADLLQYARNKIGWDKMFSTTIFGFVAHAKDDLGIGQRPERMAPYVDYISPMIYPSHYSRGNYGFSNPNAHPYEVVDGSIKDLNRLIESTGCRIRPWLQAFSMGQPRYGPNEVQAQIKATNLNDINTWLLWHPGVNYALASALKVR